MSTPQKNERRAFVFILVGLLILFFLILKPFLMPLIFGSLLVVLFYPLYKWFLRIFRDRRYVSSFAATLFVTLFFFVPAGLIASLVVNQLLGMVDQVVGFVEKEQFMQLLQKWNLNLQHLVTQMEQTFHIQVNLRVVAANAIKQFAYYVYQYSPGVLVQTLTFIFQSFITLIVVFFLFVEGRGLYQEFLRLSPLKDAHENTLALEIRNMIYSVVYGSFVTALVQGFLAGLAFYFLDIQGFLVWGALTFLFSFIPILGAGSVWVPAAVILFLTGETKSGIILSVYGALVISGIDNFLKPALMRGKNKLHPLLLFLSIVGGLSLVGPLGILLGPVTVAVLVAALKIYKQDYLPAEPA